jgi:hypothetical protein
MILASLRRGFCGLVGFFGLGDVVGHLVLSSCFQRKGPILVGWLIKQLQQVLMHGS